MRASADECWSLSTFTLQHEIALVVLAEQIYRAHSILRKEPYHRE
jgi:23S rRNA (pseudouridine1915-N3)-methyltransferase